MSLKNKALKGVFWTSLENIGNQIIGFGIGVAFARLLLPADFAPIAMLSVFIALSHVLIESGLSRSLIRAQNPDDRDYSTVFYFNLLVSLIIYGLIYLTAPLISDFYNQPQLIDIVRVYSLTFIIGAFSTIQKTRLTKLMDFKTQMLVSTPSLIVKGLVGIALALYGYGVWSLVWSEIAFVLTSTLQLWFWSKWTPLLVFDITKFKYHFKFGLNLMYSGLLNAIFSNAYPIIIGKFFAPAQLGFFTKADGMKALPVSLMSNIVNKIAYPLFSEIQNDNLRLKSVYKRIMQMVMFLVAPTLVILAVLAEPIFRFLFTEKWLPAVPYFQIICVSGLLAPIQSYNLQILNVKGRSDLFFKLEIAKKVLLSLVIFMAFQFGIYGLLYGKVMFSILAFFINTHYSGKFISYNAWQQAKDLLPTIFIACIAGLGVYLVDNYFKAHNFYDIFRILLGGIIGLLNFTALAWIFKLNAMFEFLTLLRRHK